ncbi:MAG: ankyrin repeat domain-containing protein [Thermodesulfobacteriota bacterium]
MGHASTSLLVALLAANLAIGVAVQQQAVAEETAPLAHELRNAIGRKDLEGIKALLDRGVDTNAEVYGWTPLMIAIDMGHPMIVNALL